MLAETQNPDRSAGRPGPAPAGAVNGEHSQHEGVLIDDAWGQARCRDGSGSMVGLFFSEVIEDIARAKAICALCPLASACLDGALDRQEPWGVWGGQLFADGRILAFKRRRGRPRKSEAYPPAPEVGAPAA